MESLLRLLPLSANRDLEFCPAGLDLERNGRRG